MRRRAVRAAVAAVVLSGLGCASLLDQPHYPGVVERVVACAGDGCTAAWIKAQTWLATNAPFKLSIANDTLLQTFGPGRNSLAAAYIVTRTSNSITVRVICSARFGVNGDSCAFDAAPAADALANAIR